MTPEGIFWLSYLATCCVALGVIGATDDEDVLGGASIFMAFVWPIIAMAVIGWTAAKWIRK